MGALAIGDWEDDGGKPTQTINPEKGSGVERAKQRSEREHKADVRDDAFWNSSGVMSFSKLHESMEEGQQGRESALTFAELLSKSSSAHTREGYTEIF